MITYHNIYELLRKEKYSEELQPLSKDFLKDVSRYIKEKKQILLKESDMFSEAIIKTKKQLDNAISLVKELIRRRRKKILNLAFLAAETGISKKDFENMLLQEQKLFEKVTKEIEVSIRDINGVLNGNGEREFKNKLVRFKNDIESFVDEDGNILGPFKKGEIANLPSKIVDILVQEGKADIIES